MRKWTGIYTEELMRKWTAGEGGDGRGNPGEENELIAWQGRKAGSEMTGELVK